MEALKAFEFHNLVAFLLPGLVAIRAAAYYLNYLEAAYKKAAEGGDGALAPLLLLVLSALAAGLTLNAIRQTFFDHALGLFRCWPWSQKGRDRSGYRPNYDVILKSPKKTAAYEKGVQRVYRYYQFAAHMTMAVGLLALARWERLGNTELGVTRALGAFAIVMLLCSINYFIGWCDVHNKICRSPSRAEREAARAAGPAPARPASAVSPPGAPSPVPPATGTGQGRP